MSHSRGLKTVETALPYVEHELPFRCWHYLAAKKMKEAQKQIPITHFLKQTLSFTELHSVK